MKKALCLLMALTCLSASGVETETPVQRDAHMAWWREARFGMFVHWGVYSGLNGTWQGQNYSGYAEHIQRKAKIPIPVYLKEVAGAFNPTEFNAEEWIRRAKATGMGYFIITAKHHDGFAMYDSKVSDHTIVKATPFHRDPMPELRAACKKYGIKFGFYYSHAFDWGEENAPGNDWDFQNPGGDKLLHGANWWESFPEFLPKAHKYVDEKSIPQILELIRNYDPDIFWFDTPQKLPPEENLRILAAVRKAKPSLVVNGRLVSGLGDYESTADKPEEFPPVDGDWEGIPTTNESYGYNQNDHSHKSPTHFIRLLAKASARGGNILMNIGPMGTGKMDSKDVAILQGIGQWWQVNGESIRGTTRTPLPVPAWGETTLRQGSGQAAKSYTLYLHVFQWPQDGKLVVGGLKTAVVKARLLANASRPLKLSQNGMDLTIDVPAVAPDAADSVIAIECAGEPLADAARLLAVNVGTNTLRSLDAKLVGTLQFGSGNKGNASVQNWTRTDEAVIWPVRITEKATFAATLIYDAPAEENRKRSAHGDAGKEPVRRRTVTGGIYTVTLGPQSFTKSVKNGSFVREPLGRVTLQPGNYEFSLSASEITGDELFRPRQIELVPVIK